MQVNNGKGPEEWKNLKNKVIHEFITKESRR